MSAEIVFECHSSYYYYIDCNDEGRLSLHDLCELVLGPVAMYHAKTLLNAASVVGQNAGVPIDVASCSWLKRYDTAHHSWSIKVSSQTTCFQPFTS